MPYKPNERVYRSMAALVPVEGPQYRARGYASTFDKYMLFQDEDGPVYEQIDRHAFDSADLSDVIFQFDHMGRVYARTSNGSLLLSVDDHGLLTDADLGLTHSSRDIWEDIYAKLITRMSFCFTVADGFFDQAAATNYIKRIDKVFDVSAVSFPANPGTDIEARCAYDGAIMHARAERRGKIRRLQSIITINDLMGGKQHA